MDSLSRKVRTTTASVNAVWGARLDGMVNTSEQPLNTVTLEQAKDADRPEPKRQRSWTFLL
jgi:hypothetical protein